MWCTWGEWGDAMKPFRGQRWWLVEDEEGGRIIWHNGTGLRFATREACCQWIARQKVAP